MQIAIKTLTGKQLPIHVEPEMTVGALKAKIESEHQMCAETLRLIVKGKVMDGDDQLVTEYGVGDGDFVVAMQQKAKPKTEESKPAVSLQPNSAQAA